MVLQNKYKKLRQTNPKLAEWYDFVYNRKSPKSADNMYRNIGLFCEKMGLEPDKLLELSDSGDLTEILS